MRILQVEHGVRDYDTWKQAFDSDPVGREAGGVRRYRIARATGDENLVLIELEFDAADEAQSFQERLQALWSEAGPRLGLESPTARIFDVVEEKEH